MDLLNYDSLYNQNKSVLGIWFFIIVLIVGFFLIFYNIDYENYYKNSGIVIDNNMIKIYVNKEDLNKIFYNNKLMIKDKTFAYEIKSISDILFDSIFYREVILEVKLEENLNIKNNIIDFKILLDKKTILEYIIYKIGG